jgi:hypothetical protein
VTASTALAQGTFLEPHAPVITIQTVMLIVSKEFVILSLIQANLCLFRIQHVYVHLVFMENAAMLMLTNAFMLLTMPLRVEMLSVKIFHCLHHVKIEKIDQIHFLVITVPPMQMRLHVKTMVSVCWWSLNESSMSVYRV